MAVTEPNSQSSTFVFADLAGFTALTEAHGDGEAIEMAIGFAAQVRALLPEHRAEEIKTIGDEVMIRATSPDEAVQLGLRIVEQLSAPGAPPVRVGMHTGPAVERDGDWYGGTVNLASRVADAARPGEVLLTEATRQQLGRDLGFDVVARGAGRFKHLPEPVPVYRAEGRNNSDVLEIDPVCRMAVDPEQAAASRRRFGLTYYFCSPECAHAFASGPRRYIATSRAARAARRGFLINLSVFLVVGGVHLAAWIGGGGHQEGSVPPLLFLFLAWAVVLVVHYRAVRAVL